MLSVRLVTLCSYILVPSELRNICTWLYRSHLRTSRFTTFKPPIIGWEHQWRITIPICIASGRTRFGIQADSCREEESTGRQMYIGVYDVRLIVRSHDPEHLPEVINLTEDQVSSQPIAA